jgi:hypothetical protein
MPITAASFSLRPVDEKYVNIADDVITSLHNTKLTQPFNPRAPYLVMAWMLEWVERKYISTDTIYHPHIRHIKFLLIGIAAGYVPPQTHAKHLYDATKHAPSVWMKYVATALGLMLELIYQQDVLASPTKPPQFFYVSPKARVLRIADAVACALGGWTTRARIQTIAIEWSDMSDEQALELIQTMLWTMLESRPVNGRKTR